MEIKVDEDVREMIASSDNDWRICTACTGPALVTTKVKAPKDSDIQVHIGDHVLYISRVQANYMDRVTMDMLYDEEDIDARPAFYTGRRYYYRRGGFGFLRELRRTTSP